MKNRFLQYICYASTLALFVAIADPHLFSISAAAQPWVFLGWILSFVLSATGFFST
jgi:hypothetical protein